MAGGRSSGTLELSVDEPVVVPSVAAETLLDPDGFTMIVAEK
jgi:hypothetical protein